MTRWYAAGPAHLLGHLALLPLALWGVLQALSVSSSAAAVGVAQWLVAAVIVHDLVVLPLYSTADRAARAALGRAINYVRVPAALSLLLLVVFAGTIGGYGGRTYRGVSGLSYEGYALRWLLVTAVLFALAGLAYLVRARGGSRS